MSTGKNMLNLRRKKYFSLCWVCNRHPLWIVAANFNRPQAISVTSWQQHSTEGIPIIMQHCTWNCTKSPTCKVASVHRPRTTSNLQYLELYNTALMCYHLLLLRAATASTSSSDFCDKFCSNNCQHFNFQRSFETQSDSTKTREKRTESSSSRSIKTAESCSRRLTRQTVQ